ncbi:hypothetical protein [Hanstruepera marina]|uniref:hypothetical protein n=1 Tax=Hanstruepera marina TaxID=2873265 RepID=UPI001CA6770C|nr:hypothetical protein [Hanstruepera marina]
MVKSQLPLTNISHLIPQKAPFVMVDTLLEFTNEKVVSAFKILDNNLFIENGKLNEPGLIENMAQSVALHTGYDYFLKGEQAPTGYIGSIKKIEVFKRPALNDIITTRVDILHEFDGITMVKVTAYNTENEPLASGEMKTVIAK